jgi:DNA adenine methylase
LNVLLNKLPAPTEIVTDLNLDLIHFLLTLRDHHAALADRLGELTYSKETFERAKAFMSVRKGKGTSVLDRAVHFLAWNRMSRGGLGREFAWSDRLRGGQPGDLNAWQTALAELPRVAERLREVEIYHCRAIDVIQRYDGPDVLFYCDPPYLPSTRSVLNAYQHDMTEAEHEELLDVLMGCHGTVVVSGYPSPLYDARLAGWRRIIFDMPNHSSQGKTKQRRQEVIWINQ